MTDSAAPTTIFFSYSRDDQARALPIIRLLEGAGYPVWWDGLLEGGERFSRTTEDALNRARAVVVLWSKTSVHSHWVHDEATRGRDRRVLVPLSLDGSQPPLGFGQFQVIDLSKAKLNAKDSTVQRMLRAVAALHGEEAPVVPVPKASGQAINRRLLLAGGSAVVAAGAAGAWMGGLFGGGVKGNRIAVLPFDNINDDPKYGYLAEGLANEIRATLSQNAALQVVGQASSEAFERGKQDAVAFAGKLRASFLIDGSVQVEKDIIRATIGLVDGRTGVGSPSRSFERPMDDILAVQREIAGAIAAELSSKIGAAGAEKAVIGGTTNVAAYDHYLRGKDLYVHAENETEEREGLAQFEAAIAADPKFAAAHVGRARSLAYLAGSYGSAEEIRLYTASAIQSAKRAIELAPKLADAHSALGLLLFQGNLDAKAARAPFELSRQLGEGETRVMAQYAGYAASMGQDQEALVAINRAVLLDPLNALVHRIRGKVHFAARRYPEAIASLRETIKLSPDLSETRAKIGEVLLAEGKNAEALKEFETDTHKWSRLAGVAIAQHRLGNEAASKAAMAGLTSDTDTVSLYQQGQVLAQWGELDKAVATLEEGKRQLDAGLNAARYDPALDPLRGRPDFNHLLNSMGLA